MDVLKNRWIYLSVSIILVIVSVFTLLFTKLNLGIDMTGGINMEYSYENNVNIDEVRGSLNQKAKEVLNDGESAINSVGVYKITGENSIAVTAGFYTGIEEKKLDELKTNFRDSALEIIKSQDETVIESKYTNIGKSFGDYIKDTAILTLVIAMVAITFYVTFAFSGVVSGISVFSFAMITLITLFHDVIISTGAYIFAGMFFKDFQIDTFFVTALLTILGYSINDTIVVFDRIRSNLKRFGGKKGKEGKNLEEIINLSVKQTLTRSIYTSLTLLFVLVSVFFFGPESIKGFILVMIFGTLVGTYSSIFIAAPILYEVNKNKKLSVYKKVEVNPEDKVVV